MCTHSIRALFAAGPGGHDWLSDICISNDFGAGQRSQRRNMRTVGGKLNSCQTQWIRSPDGKAPEWVCKTTAQSSHVEPGHKTHSQDSQDTESHSPVQPGHEVSQSSTARTRLTAQYSQDTKSHSPVQPGHVSQPSTARTQINSAVQPGHNVS